MGEHDTPAVGREAGDAPATLVDVDELLLEGADLAGLQDGIAAQSHDHRLRRLAHCGDVLRDTVGLLPRGCGMHIACVDIRYSCMHRIRVPAERLTLAHREVSLGQRRG